MAKDDVTIDATPDQAFDLARQRLQLNAGIMGSFFGTGPNVPMYIAALTMLFLFLGGMILSFFETKMPAVEYWKFAASAISGCVGFIFGRKV